jgi:hypothetical protein
MVLAAGQNRHGLDHVYYGVLRGRNEYRRSGAVATTVNGATYFTFGGGYYQPFYGGSDVIYQIVSNPSAS